jgi:hypothetical protein
LPEISKDKLLVLKILFRDRGTVSLGTIFMRFCSLNEEGKPPKEPLEKIMSELVSAGLVVRDGPDFALSKSLKALFVKREVQLLVEYIFKPFLVGY